MMQQGTTFFQRFLAVGFLLFSGYHLWTTAFGMPVAQLHRPVHVMFAVSLGFLISSSPGSKRSGHLKIANLLPAIASLVCFGWIALSYQRISERQAMVETLSFFDLAVGGLSILLLLELARRTVGWVLTAVAMAALLYAYFGKIMPGLIAHRGFSLSDIIDHLNFGLEGIYSIPIGVSSTYIVIFIIFGTFLEMSGSGAVLMDLGKALTGRYRGGPAKIAVLTSAFFGTISGSAAANVYATGSFTIPMMKKAGYDPAFAGAVEASASTGGQIMPPVMGAAAFLMADILGIPYLQVCKAALIPAVLYFFSLLIMVDFEAARKGLRGVGPEELPSLKATLKRSYLLLPIGVLLAAMIWGYTPFRAAFLATVSTVVISFFSRKDRMGIRTILKALVVSGQRTVLIATACGVAGIIIGVVTLTGIGLNISSVIISASGGIRIIGLVLIMISSIIMGMGTPTTVAYVIVATLGVPALGKLGFDVLPSHFFVFYFGVLSMVTPPVAVAAYAAAEISGENMMKIGLRATKLCFVAFIIPFAFMYEPGLLMLGSWPTIAMEFSTAAIGIVGLAASFHAWLWVPIGWLFRVLFFAAALLLITPGFQTNFMGLGLFLILVAWLYYKKGRKANFSPLE